MEILKLEFYFATGKRKILFKCHKTFKMFGGRINQNHGYYFEETILN